MIPQLFGRRVHPGQPRLGLEDGSRVGVIGGGPAGAFFSYFLLDLARLVNLDVAVDIYEPRDFSVPGPRGCNMCAGIISERLVQYLANEGINLPAAILQSGVDAYNLHTDVGHVRLDASRQEKRIAAVYRGAGPAQAFGFDRFLLEQAEKAGANVIRGRVDEVARVEAGRLQIKARGHAPQTYDLVAAAAGVNTPLLKALKQAEPGYRPPVTFRTAIREYRLGTADVERYLGSALHVFLLDLPGLDFAAMIPKGDYMTICLLGDIADGLFEAFLNAPEVRRCLPPHWQPEQFVCHCSPRINVAAAAQPYGDRVVFVGDSGTTRLFKDGIGAAHRAAKAAAVTAVFYGIGAEDFRRHYWPTCQALAADNLIGKVIFAATHQIQRRRFARRAVLRMAAEEQEQPPDRRRLSAVLWDTFTGSAPYQEILWRILHPFFWGPMLWHLGASLMQPAAQAGQAVGI